MVRGYRYYIDVSRKEEGWVPESCEVAGTGKVNTHIWTLSLSPDVGM